MRGFRQSCLSSIARVKAGDTVSLRVVTSAGPREIVGTLVAASAERLTIRRRDGSVTEVTVDSVAAGRVVPPGPSRTVGVGELQRIAARGWRALEVAPLGDWLLRASGGFTGRGNSALVTGEPGIDLGDAVDRIEGWYGARGLPARIQLPDPGQVLRLPSLLDERGWSPSPPSHVMTGEAGAVLRGSRRDMADVHMHDAPDDAWLACYRQDTPDRSTDGLPAAAVALLRNHDSAVFASVRDGDRCIAIARAAVDDRWAGLYCVEVDPERRGEGLGTTVSLAALRWSVAQGARRVYLQVVADNKPAVDLYARLGFAVHHDYVYRSAPSDGSDHRPDRAAEQAR
jgi:GNAT superfamily N-acetyltransferase